MPAAVRADRSAAGRRAAEGLEVVASRDRRFRGGRDLAGRRDPRRPADPRHLRWLLGAAMRRASSIRTLVHPKPKHRCLDERLRGDWPPGARQRRSRACFGCPVGSYWPYDRCTTGFSCGWRCQEGSSQRYRAQPGRKATPSPKPARRMARAVGGSTGSASQVAQVRLQPDEWEALQEAMQQLRLSSTSEALREGLRLLTREAVEIAAAEGIRRFYGSDDAPRPDGVVPATKEDLAAADAEQW